MAVIDENRYPDTTTSQGRDTVNQALRAIGLVAGCVLLVLALVALVTIDWSVAGFSSPIVRVSGMEFSPWLAVATAVGGLVAILAAVSLYRSAKLVIGAVLACIGLAVMIAEPTVDHALLDHRFGVLVFAVGLVLAATALVMRPVR